MSAAPVEPLLLELADALLARQALWDEHHEAHPEDVGKMPNEKSWTYRRAWDAAHDRVDKAQRAVNGYAVALRALTAQKLLDRGEPANDRRVVATTAEGLTRALAASVAAEEARHGA